MKHRRGATEAQRKFYVRLGQCIEIERKRRNVSQRELAKAIGISQGVFCQYESGSVKCPVWVLDAISFHLKMSIADLIA